MTLLFAMAGAAGLAVFLLPVFTGRILNIGNMTGMALCACLLFYFVFKEKADGVVRKMIGAGGFARAFVLGAGLILCLIALTAFILTVLIVRAALKSPAPDSVVIVLGCEVKGKRPSRILKSRIDAAAGYLREHPDAVCVVSGGKGEREEISEAECMYLGLTAQGIAPDRILKEDRSVSTRENLLYSRQILQEAGMGDKNDAAIVTSEFHALRAHLIAGKLGFRCGTIPARTPWWLLPTFYVRELYGVLYQLFL